MGNEKDSEKIIGDELSSDSESSPYEEDMSDSDEYKVGCDEISKQELLRSLKVKFNKSKISLDCNLKRKRSETSDVDFNKQLESALLEIHRDTVLNGLKRKLYGHEFKNNSMKTDAKDDTKLTRFSVKYFSKVLDSLSEHQKTVISKSCFRTMLLFGKCSIPYEFALWIAHKVDVSSSDIIVRDKVIPLCKESVHIVLGLPVGGLPISSSFEVGKQKILDSFGISSLASVKFFGDKFIKKENMSDEQILMSFMIVCLNCFLCPNSSLQPSTKYLSVFEDLTCIENLDWSNLVFEWLMKHIGKLDKSKSFGGCLFYLVVNYLDFLNFGMRKVLQDIPRIKVWKGTMIKKFSKFDRFSKGVYGKRPVKDLSDCCYKLIVTDKPSQRTFLQMLDSSIGIVLPEDVKKDINELLLHHFGPDEQSVDERAKKLLIDVFVVLSNASKKPVDEDCKSTVPENTDVNCSEDNKSNLNDGNIINDDNGHVSPKVNVDSPCYDMSNEQSPMNCNEKNANKLMSSQKDIRSDVDGIMKKLCKQESTPTCYENKDCSPCEDDDFSNDQDDLRNEETPNNNVNSNTIVPDSYSPVCPTEIYNNKILPRDLSQTLQHISDSQMNISDNENKIVMITLEDSEPQSQFLTQHNDKENLLVKRQDEQLCPHKKDSPDILFLGERKYVDNCVDLTSKTNVLYNKINTFVVNPEKKLKLSTGSPERILLCNIGNCSTSEIPQHDLRRILQPARYSTDPYSPARPSFPVTQYERQVYNAVCKISKSKFQDKVAVDIDGVHCKFYTFGDSFRPGGELSNFVTSVFCRYMFRLCHPSKSRKHYFFSSIGDDLLKDRSMTNFNAVKKCFDGASLARPVHTCDLLFFPIIKNHHWFVFAVDLKAKRFVFLDSLYDEYSSNHEQLRPKLISNFSLAWNIYVENHPIDFNNFIVIYPPVPKQTNRVDCGIFALKFMEIWGPRVLLPNLFSQRDFPQIRIQLLNKMLFHPNNSNLSTGLYQLLNDHF